MSPWPRLKKNAFFLSPLHFFCYYASATKIWNGLRPSSETIWAKAGVFEGWTSRIVKNLPGQGPARGRGGIGRGDFWGSHRAHTGFVKKQVFFLNRRKSYCSIYYCQWANGLIGNLVVIFIPIMLKA